MPHEQHYLDNSPTPEQDFVSAANVTRTDKDFIVKNFFNFTNTEFNNQKGQKFARVGVRGATYSMAASEFLVGITALAVAPTLGLPRPKLVGAGKSFIVKDEVGGAATTTITVVSQGEETIDGAANTTLTANFQAKRFYTDGANWFTY